MVGRRLHCWDLIALPSTAGERRMSNGTFHLDLRGWQSRAGPVSAVHTIANNACRPYWDMKGGSTMCSPDAVEPWAELWCIFNLAPAGYHGSTITYSVYQAHEITWYVPFTRYNSWLNCSFDTMFSWNIDGVPSSAVIYCPFDTDW